jgi:NADH-quinone oxidoreductase subunit C/D
LDFGLGILDFKASQLGIPSREQESKIQNPRSKIEMMDVRQEVVERFSDSVLALEETRDRLPTLWIAKERVPAVLRYLKQEAARPYRMLYDLTAIDERVREHRQNQLPGDFSVVYHLLSFERNEDVRIKVPLQGEAPSLPSITGLWPAANWYECEVWDMFGIRFEGHPHLRRILMPSTWKGHPLRKDHPARATEMGPFQLPDEKQEKEQQALQFRPEDWGLERHSEETDFMFLNLGPQHPGTHGVLRIVLQLDGEEILDAVPDIGYHHRGAEKMAERQSWHTFIPYTDRVDYLGGVMNNLAYVLAVETLAGIKVPDRAKVIRVMMAELFRLASHLVWYGTFASDVGAMSPVFYMFSDRERIFEIVEAVCGARMHPGWFRIGGVAQDLPQGWDRLVRNFLDYMPKRLAEYDRLVMQNRIFKARTQGVGCYDTAQAIEWGVTGPGLRATGFEWDFRKKRPYSGYDQFEFDIPIAQHGDCYDRGVVRVEEMRQSLRIIRQCLEIMPPGPYKSDHPLATPSLKEHTMHDIETLITHFLGVSWGPVIPPGEAFFGIEATKGSNGYYLVSDGNTMSYRTRIRAPSFPHLQMVPLLSRGSLVPDLLAILGSIDFVLADVDR